jgi:hypothetical protein
MMLKETPILLFLSSFLDKPRIRRRNMSTDFSVILEAIGILVGGTVLMWALVKVVTGD